MDRNTTETRGTGLEPALGVALAVFGLAAVVLVAGSPALGTDVRLGLIPAGGAIAGHLVLRHRDRRENRRRERQLVEAVSEIREKSQLLSGVAHEIQDPLTSLLGLSELLRENLTLSPDEMREFIDLMHAEANDLAMLAEDLYVVSVSGYDGMESHGPSQVDLLLEAGAAAQSLEQRDRDVTVRGSDLVVTIDRRRLRHVLRSLLANVERFGGPTVEIVVEERNGVPTVLISDDGPPLDDEPRAGFDVPGSAPRTGRSGLRVAIASMMAESLGGRLAYERSPGWTNFILSLGES